MHVRAIMADNDVQGHVAILAHLLLSDASRVVDRLLRYLMDIDKVRGAGRLWLP
jgi:hypothetical protein